MNDLQNKLNLHHSLYPKEGDYWHERFSPVMCVVEVSDMMITVLTEKKQFIDYWKWDITKIKTMLRKEFYDYVQYKNIPNAFWCDVIPDRCKEYSLEAKEFHSMDKNYEYS